MITRTCDNIYRAKISLNEAATEAHKSRRDKNKVLRMLVLAQKQITEAIYSSVFLEDDKI
jgi:hypothetical protein